MAYKRHLIAKTKNLYDGLNHYVVSKNWPADKKIWTGDIAVTCCFSFYQNLSDVNSPSGALFRFEYSDNSISYRVPVNQTGLVRADAVLYPTENKRLIGISIVNYSGSTGDVYNMLLEKGSSMTTYVPYGYLPSYKSKLKIAKVNQLLDKSKFPATATENGVTITNNNDGSFTFTGGVTTTGAVGYLGIISHYPLKKGHRYICPIQELKVGDTSSYVELVITKSNGDSIWSNDYLVEEDGMICRVGCLKYGTDTTPHIVKPIFIDLTEMYGPQHMPTDAMAFFADYPIQALDKTKFSLGQTTINGVTFTNNGDGTITANGTATERATYVVENVYTEIVGHKCLLRGCPLGGSTSTYALHDSFWGVVDIGHGVIANVANRQIVIDVFAGVTCESLIFKPEFVDLTALGLDSTITSPEQFSPKVDYIPFAYDYAPKCWLTSYKHNLIATTKNLLSYSETTAKFPGAEWENTNPRDLAEGVWYVATSANNYSIKHTVIDYKIERNLLYINVNQAAYGLSRAFKCNPGEVYNISVKGKGNTQLGVGFFDMGGNYLSCVNENKSSLSFTTPTNCKWFWVNFAASQNNSKVYFRDIQLEKGSSPTDYVPNGYL